LLVQRGADPEIADKRGHTAVWFAACGTHCPDALELMLKKGAHISGTDSNGWNLLEYAMCFAPCQPGRIGFPGFVLTPAEQQAYDAREERTIDLLISAGLDPSGKEGTDMPLKTVLKHNHYPAARALLRHHPDLKIKDAQGNPAITYLFSHCFSNFPLDVLETLLQQGADPNGSYPNPGVAPRAKITVLQTALASQFGTDEQALADHRAAVRKLIEHGAKFPGVKSAANQALLLAASKGDQTAMKEALKKGASPDATDGFVNSPMQISMNLRYFDNAVWLLSQGVDPKQSPPPWGNQLLSAAAQANRADMVKLLISKGVGAGDGDLEFAIRNRNREIFDMLLKAGADPKQASVFSCIQFGQPEMARVLLNGGADPQPPPFAENRANVYWAVCYRQTEILKMLLDRNADPTILDAYGETPLSVAKEFNPEMVSLIEKAIQRRQPRPAAEDQAHKAAEAFQQARYDEAASLYQQILKAHPDNFQAWSNLAVDRFQQGRCEEARHAFQKAILLKPDDEPVVAGLGETCYRLEAFDDAISALRTAILLNPNDANAHYFLSVSYRALKQEKEGESELQKARDIQKQNAPAVTPPAGAAAEPALPPAVTLQTTYLSALAQIALAKDETATDPPAARADLSQAMDKLQSIHAKDPSWERASVLGKIDETTKGLSALPLATPKSPYSL
jgi:ankyrin repeat protein